MSILGLAKRAFGEFQDQHGSNLCRKGGSPLVERMAKTGADAGKPFLGYSTFPKCRYTREIGEQR